MEIIPKFKEKVAICLVINEPFAIFASVTLQSIIDFSSDKENYDIFICTDKEFSDSTKNLLKNQIPKKTNFSLRFINLSDFFDMQNAKNQSIVYPTIVFGRLFLPFILDNYERIIYLDSDIILNTDISSFYSIKLGENCIGAVNDLVMLAWLRDKKHFAYKKLIDKVKIQDTTSYINSGFLVFDVMNYNKFITPEKIIAFEEKHYLAWPDQDLINIVFHDKIHFLPQNCNVLVALRDDKTAVESSNDRNLIESYNNSFKNPKVIHFLSCSFLATKYPVSFYDLYWKTARKTPFYETLLTKAVSTSAEVNLYALVERSSLRTLLKIVIKKLLKRSKRIWSR